MKFKELDSHTNQELLTWYDIITKQNYFINKNNIITQNDGLVMRPHLLAPYQKFSYNT